MELISITCLRSLKDNADDEVLNDRQLETVEKIFSSLSTSGFLQLCDHSFNETLSLAFNACNTFFHKSLQEKLCALSRDKARRGYSPMLSENFASLVGESGKPNDCVEKYRIGPLFADSEKAMDPDYYSSKEGRIHFFENCWENMAPDCQLALTAYYKEVKDLADLLLLAIAVGLGLRKTFFATKMTRSTSILCANHYPLMDDDSSIVDNQISSPQPRPEQKQLVELLPPSPSLSRSLCRPRLRVAAHTDVSMITIVAPSGPGLEIYQESSSSWQPVPFVPGALVVNIGDCLRDWSGGLLKSTLHRVVLPDTSTIKSDIAIDSNICGGKAEETQNGLEDVQGDIPSVAGDCAVDCDAHPSVGVCPQPTRLSLAFFVSPDHDAAMDWPRPVIDGISGPGRGGADVLTYAKWRQQRIAQCLQQQKLGQGKEPRQKQGVSQSKPRCGHKGAKAASGKGTGTSVRTTAGGSAEKRRQDMASSSEGNKTA